MICEVDSAVLCAMVQLSSWFAQIEIFYSNAKVYRSMNAECVTIHSLSLSKKNVHTQEEDTEGLYREQSK